MNLQLENKIALVTGSTAGIGLAIAAGLARNPGIVATALHYGNAVPYVVAAQPGLLSYLDLPLVAGRAVYRRLRRLPSVLE